MPTPAHNRFTFSGVFGQLAAPQEIWTVRLITNASPPADDAAAKVLAGRARAAFGQHVMPLLSAQTPLTRTRWSAHAAGGGTLLRADGSFMQGDDTTVVPGGVAVGTILPIQTALAVSLMTPRAGATGRGRIFLPFIHRPVQAGAFTLQDVHTQSVADGVRALIVAINGFGAGGDFGPFVTVASSKGYETRVTGVRVGNVLDTMRSRRNGLREGYAVSAPF